MVTIQTIVQIKQHVRANFLDFSSPEKCQKSCVRLFVNGTTICCVKLNIGYSFGKKLLEESNYSGINYIIGLDLM